MSWTWFLRCDQRWVMERWAGCNWQFAIRNTHEALPRRLPHKGGVIRRSRPSGARARRLGDTGSPLRGRTADERGGPMSSSTETLLPRLLRSRVLPPKGGEQEHAVLVIGGDPFSPLRGENKNTRSPPLFLPLRGRWRAQRAGGGFHVQPRV